MIVVDVNLLVAASRRDHVHHPIARPFFSDALAHDDVIVPDAVWSGFLRVVTSRRIFHVPTPMADAISFVRAVTSSSRYRLVAGLVDGLDPLLSLIEASESTSDLVPDAYIAAVAMAHGCPVATLDRDFRRFDGLRIVTPTAPA